MEPGEVQTHGKTRKILTGLFKFCAFFASLLLWLMYAYATLDRSEKVLKATGGDPIPSKESFLILLVIYLFFFWRETFARKISLGSILAKVAAVLIFLLAVLSFVASS